MTRDAQPRRAAGGPQWKLRLCIALALACAGPANAQHVVLQDTTVPQHVKPQALLRDMLEGRAPLILDVRSKPQFDRGHIPGAVNVPHKQVPGRWEEILPYKHLGVVVYCQRGNPTRSATQALVVERMRKIGILEGYFAQWERLGYPVARTQP